MGVVGYSNSELLSRMQSLYGKSEKLDDVSYLFAKGNVAIMYEWDYEIGYADLTYIDMNEFEKVYGGYNAKAYLKKAVKEKKQARRFARRK